MLIRMGWRSQCIILPISLILYVAIELAAVTPVTGVVKDSQSKDRNKVIRDGRSRKWQGGCSSQSTSIPNPLPVKEDNATS